jgi:hypothetical protein
LFQRAKNSLSDVTVTHLGVQVKKPQIGGIMSFTSKQKVINRLNERRTESRILLIKAIESTMKSTKISEFEIYIPVDYMSDLTKTDIADIVKSYMSVGWNVFIDQRGNQHAGYSTYLKFS